ncbi:DUF4349 domain-containing protein [Microaceticoccus formicicus]|uniref:DUF4349 domain-containing protein n=1 Tax=Microaceticoccus formicicus TaxID=3118105 RepID=UPI003CD0088F|nr:DUF4349 domain-containing protein [Peptoniphilaceae bacterium AMB_02]
MRKRNVSIVLLLVLFLVFTACSKPASKNEYEMPAGEIYISDRDFGTGGSTTEDYKDAGESAEESKSVEPEKVIVTIDMNFETTKFEESVEKINEAAKAVKAYVQDSNIEFGSSYNRKVKYAYITIRVPKDKVEEFKASLGEGVGTLISENISKSDVTKTYRDNETRLRVLQDKENRLRELLKKAETVENIIEIENSLSETITKIEIIKSDLQNIDDKVDYSTVYIQLKEVKVITQVETPTTSYFDRLKNAVSGSMKEFVEGMGDLLISFIYFFPNLILLIILFVILRLIYKFLKKRLKGFKFKSTKKKEVLVDEEDDETGQNPS